MTHAVVAKMTFGEMFGVLGIFAGLAVIAIAILAGIIYLCGGFK